MHIKAIYLCPIFPVKYLLVVLIPLLLSCHSSMHIQTIPYNSQLKKKVFEEIPFYSVGLQELPKPYYKDYSHHSDPAYRKYKKWDTFGFRDRLLSLLGQKLGNEVLKLILISPRDPDEDRYEGYAFLLRKEIVPLHLENRGYFKDWMDIIFEKMYEEVVENKKEGGLYERQPELNSSPQFRLTLGKGMFSKGYVNSGMLVDERPYEQTGKYLFKQAPKDYKKREISKKKQSYLKAYINTKGAQLDSAELSRLFQEFWEKRKLIPNPPIHNDQAYQDFEKVLGFPFPAELKVLFKYHNGLRATHWEWLSIDQIIAEWKGWKSIYEDWTLEDLIGNNNPDGKHTLGIYTNPYWIPFMRTGGGNFLAIDYAPGPEGKSGQIIAFGADEIKIRFIAEDMKDYLLKLIAGKDGLGWD